MAVLEKAVTNISNTVQRLHHSGLCKMMILFPLHTYLEAELLDHKGIQYFGHLMRRVDSLEKTDAGRDRRQEEKGTTQDEMAGWHHQLDGRESE